jgi:phytol kinase
MEGTHLIQLILGIVLAGSPLLLTEFLVSHITLPPEASRKIVHIGSSLTTILLTLFLTLEQIAVIAAVFVLFLFTIRSFYKWKSLDGVLRESLGEVFFPLGVLAASLLSQSVSVFIASMLVLGFADSAAHFVGIRYGKRRIPGTSKTYIGSLAMFTVTFLIITTFVNSPVYQLLMTSSFIAMAEAISQKGSDNLTVPLTCVLLLNITQ